MHEPEEEVMQRLQGCYSGLVGINSLCTVPWYRHWNMEKGRSKERLDKIIETVIIWGEGFQECSLADNWPKLDMCITGKAIKLN